MAARTKTAAVRRTNNPEDIWIGVRLALLSRYKAGNPTLHTGFRAAACILGKKQLR